MKLSITFTLCALLYLTGPAAVTAQEEPPEVPSLHERQERAWDPQWNCIGWRRFSCRVYNPLCGTDGVTYSHICNLCKTRETSGLDLWVRHRGKCARG